MSNHKKKAKRGWAEKIEESLLPHGQLDEPLLVSVIIPIYNCSEVIATTLESVGRQEYDPVEVIMIDAGSTDRTLDIVNTYSSIITRIYTVTEFNLPDMMNRGISLASGSYITFLFPGCAYLSDTVYLTFAKTAAQTEFPDLLYCGAIQRELKQEPRLIQLPFDIKLIHKGISPAILPACWIRRDLFEEIGKFDTRHTIRPGFEFFSRLLCEKKLSVEQIDRIFVDFDYGLFSYGKMLRYAGETWHVLSTYFGLRRALIWFWSVNHFLLAKWLWRRFKEVLFQR